jgi:hypothetical protein
MTTTPRMGITRETYSPDVADILDRIVSALEAHRHEGGTRIADPVVAPTLSVADTGGSLAAGTTYFYQFSLVDEYGFETLCGAQRSATTVGAILAPGAPIIGFTAGGSLKQGITYWALTSIAGGVETQLGPPRSAQVGIYRTANLTIPTTPSGADHIGVWRKGAFAVGYTKVGTIVAGVTTFVDDGSVIDNPAANDPGNQPPSVNTTNAFNSIQASIPPALIAPGTGVRSWRLYRSTQSGSYSASALVHEVFETDSNGLILSSWVDLGGTLSAGTPQFTSRTLTPPQTIDLPIGSELPAVTNQLDGTPFIVRADGALSLWIYSATSGSYELISGGGGAAAPGYRLLDAGGVVWQLGVLRTGLLTTSTMSSGAASPPIYIADSGGNVYLLGVDVTGALTLTAAPAGSTGVTVFVPASDDPTSVFMVGVSTDGNLTTSPEPIILNATDDPSMQLMLVVNSAGVVSGVPVTS